MKHISIDTVKQAADGHWHAIIGALAPALDTALARQGKHVPCPVHGGKDGFRLFDDFDTSGGGVCNTCGPHAGGIALLMWANEWDFPTALREVARVLGLDPGTGRGTPVIAVGPRSPSKPASDPREDERLRQRLIRIWRQTVALDDPAANAVVRYLRRRGLVLDQIPNDLRAHPGLEYYDSDQHIGKFPAMVAMVRDPEGAPVTLHATYLTPEGHKAPVENVKKLLAYPKSKTLRGAAIRLSGTAEAIGVAEGIETALAVHIATGMPVWSAVTASLLARFVPPTRVKRVYVWGDRDRKGRGQSAAAQAIQHMRDLRLAAVDLLPPERLMPAVGKGVDWLDVYTTHPEAIQVPPGIRRSLLKASRRTA